MLVNMTQVHARSEWADISPAFSTPHQNVPDIFIHHEGGAVRGNPANKPAVLREIEHGVLNKGYIAIDYNLMVFADGSVWEGRGLAHEDGATINNNATSVSICAVGNFQLEQPTPQLMQGLADAIAIARSSAWASDTAHVRLHQEVFATACPGGNLVAQIKAIPSPAPPPVAAPKEKVYMNIVITEGANGQLDPNTWHLVWANGHRVMRDAEEVNTNVAVFKIDVDRNANGIVPKYMPRRDFDALVS